MRWLFVMLLSESSGTLKSTSKVRVSRDYSRGRSEGLRKGALEAMAVEFTYPYEDFLALQVDVGDGELVGERHCVEGCIWGEVKEFGLPIMEG